MSRRFTLLTVALSALVAFLVGLILAGEFTPAPIVSSAPRGMLPGPLRPASLTEAPTVVNFADVAERINGAVVNIDAISRGSDRDPLSLFHRGDAPSGTAAPRDSDSSREGSGSGFLIDREGFILTNHHVIESAQRITVTLADGRSFRAEVVGRDPAIDVALLKISGGGRDLPEAPLGNSDELRVGEWVCAIGNPLGYVHSVTVGVVSFIGRKLFDASLDDFIQTDAAINFGNSGGPLINARGEVIGINSAISARVSNIGFAVPINQAIAILPQLKASGRVSRGYMGILLTDVTPALQRSLGLATVRGALVQDVTAGSPAERAGLHVYDVIVDVEGLDVSSHEELIRNISARQPGTVARLGVARDARRMTLPVRLAERPVRSDGDSDSLDDTVARPAAAAPDLPLGLAVRELDRAFASRLAAPEGLAGVVVSRVDPTGTAFSASVRRGFVIMEINRKPVRSVADYQRIVAAAHPGEVLTLFCFDPTLAQRTLVTVTME